MEEFKSIKQWAVEDRPIEKLITKGSDALSNAELLAILINTGTQNKSALSIAKELLEKGNYDLLTVSKFSINDIKKIKGIGEKKAVTIVAALELGKRRQLAQAVEIKKIETIKQSYEVLVTYFLNNMVEQFYVMYLNNAQQILAIEKMSEGGITSTIVDVRIIFKRALELINTTKIIVAHNHPSGNITPSEEDKKLTEKLKEASKLLEIKLLDHLIIGNNNYYSFANAGLL